MALSLAPVQYRRLQMILVEVLFPLDDKPPDHVVRGPQQWLVMGCPLSAISYANTTPHGGGH